MPNNRDPSRNFYDSIVPAEFAQPQGSQDTVVLSAADYRELWSRMEAPENYAQAQYDRAERLAQRVKDLEEFWDCSMSASVGLSYDYATGVVTNTRAEEAEARVAELLREKEASKS
jgi:hypothetical protein